MTAEVAKHKILSSSRAPTKAALPDGGVSIFVLILQAAADVGSGRASICGVNLLFVRRAALLVQLLSCLQQVLLGYWLSGKPEYCVHTKKTRRKTPLATDLASKQDTSGKVALETHRPSSLSSAAVGCCRFSKSIREARQEREGGEGGERKMKTHLQFGALQALATAQARLAGLPPQRLHGVTSVRSLPCVNDICGPKAAVCSSDSGKKKRFIAVSTSVAESEGDDDIV